jgi:N4-gp56 family major capsid protein
MFAKLIMFLFPGVTNSSPGSSGQTIANNVELHIANEVLRLSQRTLVAYQFGQPITLNKQTGVTYTATRYERLPLPFAPLSEGVAAAGESITIAQVSATAQQWGDLVRVTDVADMTIKHPLFKQAIRLIAIQQPETVERNVINNLLSGTQVNYSGTSKGSRFVLASGDVLAATDVSRVVAAFESFGVPMFNGDERTDMKRDMGARLNASRDPGAMPHYVALISPFTAQDLRNNNSITTAWANSDVNRLYNNEVGEWSGVRFCKSNMLPYWTGVAQVNGTASTVGGALATATLYIIVTASPVATSVEQRIYQVSASMSVTGPTGSISVSLPVLPGYTFNIYIGSTTSPTNLALCASGPTTGPMAGQATQLSSGSTVVLTGIGMAQTPPAPVATGVTVSPTLFFGVDAYGQVLLDDVKYTYLSNADKSDPMNQTRVVAWKMMYGTIILNNAYLARYESVSAYSPGFTVGTASE